MKRENIKVLITEEEVDRKIREMADKISREYEGKEIHMICVLKGGVFFMTELAKRISVPVSMDFMAVSSYEGTQSTCKVRIVKDLDESVEGKDVLVVEDIVDTGRTLGVLLDMFRQRGASSVKLCTLLDKPDGRVTDVQVDYECFTVPDKFVVGYGLDYDENYRNLPFVGVLKPEVYSK